MKTHPQRHVRVNTDLFQFAHDRKPRGFGWWWFRVGQEQFSFPGSFGTARQRAVRVASSRGETCIQVLP